VLSKFIIAENVKVSARYNMANESLFQKIKKRGIMNNRRMKSIGLVLCVLSGLLMMSCSPATDKTLKQSNWSNVGRYENKTIGFSIEYDADKLDQTLPPEGQDIFKRSSSEEFPILAITTSPYPQGTPLKDIGRLIAGAFPSFVPGSRVLGVSDQKMIKLSDQTEASYFALKWNTGDMDLSTIFVIAQKNNFMVMVKGTDKADKPLEGLAAMVKTLKFDIKVGELAQPSMGTAKDGHFVRTASPSFTLAYPKEFQKLPLQTGQILNAGIPQGFPSLTITIAPLESDQDIKTQLRSQADSFANALKSFGSDIKVISNESIDNYQEFPAHQFRVIWKYGGQILITTMAHAIIKENNVILLAGHTIYDTDELLDIFKTINLNP
jgi:hypothetical protein